jgi:zinc protease
MTRLAGTLAVVAALLVALPGVGWAIDIRTVSTPLGLKAWLVHDRSAPALSLSFSFAGGTASDPAGQAGLTTLASALLSDGAGAFPAQTFRLRQEEAGASISFAASLDRLHGSLRVLSASRDDGFDLLRLALGAPRFDSEMLEQRRAQMVAALRQAWHRPRSVAARSLMETVFAGHPYARNPDGTIDELRQLRVQDLRERTARLLQRSGLIIAAVGDIEESELARQLDRTFGDLPQGDPPSPLPDWTPTQAARRIVIERPVPQSAALIGLPSLTRDDPDWYALLVLNHVLGGSGQQSRLFDAVREKRGLAYSASSSVRTWRKAGLLVISTASANARIAQSLDVVSDELARLRRTGPTEQEVDDAKTYLGGSLALSLDSSQAIAGLLHSMQVDGLAPDHLDKRAALIAAVTLADVRRLAERLLDQHAMTTVVVGQPAGLAP